MSGARMVLVENIYHQGAEGSPTGVSRSYARHLTTDEQPYTRATTCGPEWRRLETGWIEDEGCSLLYLLNEETLTGPTQPTPQEKEQRASRCLQLGLTMLVPDSNPLLPEVVICFARLHPGQPLQFPPDLPLNRLRIRATQDRCKYRLVALPR